MNGKLLNRIIRCIDKTGGVSVDIETRTIIPRQNCWMFPKYPSKTQILPHDINLKGAIIEYLDTNSKRLLEPDCFLGIWLNPNSNEYYLDITTMDRNKEKAIRRARKISALEKRDIVAIYNPVKDKTIFL